MSVGAWIGVWLVVAVPPKTIPRRRLPILDRGFPPDFPAVSLIVVEGSLNILAHPPDALCVIRPLCERGPRERPLFLNILTIIVIVIIPQWIDDRWPIY